MKNDIFHAAKVASLISVSRMHINVCHSEIITKNIPLDDVMFTKNAVVLKNNIMPIFFSPVSDVIFAGMHYA